jgi:putative tryptophan/tyrosine transport system substrate-binding protein
MNYRLLSALVAVLVWLLPDIAGAQANRKVAKIGFLSADAAPIEPDWKQRSEYYKTLRDLGWREGENLQIESRWANTHLDRLPSLAAELIAERVDVIVAGAFKPGQAAIQATRNIPVVLVTCDPYQLLVGSLARPGGNVTGQTCMSAEISPKKLQFLKEAVPGIRRVAFLYNPDDPGPALALKLCLDAASGLGIALLPFPIQRVEELARVVAQIDEAKVDGLFVYPDAVTARTRNEIVDFASLRRLPAVGGFKPWAQSGLLLSYGASLPDMRRRAMIQVDRILKDGVKAGDLPIEQPTHFELVINQKTAKSFGITIPQSLLLRADEMID